MIILSFLSVILADRCVATSVAASDAVGVPCASASVPAVAGSARQSAEVASDSQLSFRVIDMWIPLS